MSHPYRPSVKPASERGRQLNASLSRRLSAMASNVANKRDSGTVMAPEDIAGLADSLRDLVNEARTLEASKGGVSLNASVEPCFRLLLQAETHLGITRNIVLGRLGAEEADPDGTIVQALAEISARIEQAGNILAGRGKTQS